MHANFTDSSAWLHVKGGSTIDKAEVLIKFDYWPMSGQSHYHRALRLFLVFLSPVFIPGTLGTKKLQAKGIPS